MEPFDGLDLRFSKRWKGLRERYFIRRGLNWYGDNTNQRKYNDRNWICQAVAFSLLGVFPYGWCYHQPNISPTATSQTAF
jgi:hypothetical protein